MLLFSSTVTANNGQNTVAGLAGISVGRGFLWGLLNLPPGLLNSSRKSGLHVCTAWKLYLFLSSEETPWLSFI